MKIRTKLVTTFLVIAALVVVTGYLSSSNLNLVGMNFHKVQQESMPKVIVLNKIKSNLSFLVFETKEFSIEPTQEILESFETAKLGLINASLKYQSLETEDAQSINKGVKEIVPLVDEIIKLGKDGASQEVLLEKSEEFNEKAEELSQLTDLEIERQNKELEESQTIVNNQIQNAFSLNLVFTLIALSLAIGMGVLISRSIYKPLMKLKDAAQEITGGNLDVEIRPSKTDEIGDLASRFDTMRQSVKEADANLNQLVKVRTNQLERLNEELILKDKMKDEFINIASHELRTPVQPILSYIDLASKGHVKHEEALNFVAKNAKRLQKLTNDILDVSQIETGQMTYTVEKVSVNDLIYEVVDVAKVNLNGDISIITSLDNDVHISADRGRITQVLTNIVGNAIKFTKRGTIKVETKVFADKNQVVIKISDTGLGIPEHILPNLFGKFVTSSARDMSQHGTGLGLFISKAIVNAHKGEISACNNSEGGARFTIVLPIDSSKITN